MPPMQREEMEKIVEASLARPIATYNTSDLPRDDFLAQEKAHLRACLVEPREVNVRPCGWALEQCGFEDRPYAMLSIATDGDNWLFYEPASGLFYKGWDADDFGLSFLGFCSDDALSEWLG